VVRTAKAGDQNVFRVTKGKTAPLHIEFLNKSRSAQSGTVVQVARTTGNILSAATIRAELGRRFLTDPSFQVVLDGVRIDFEDIEDKGLDVFKVQIPELEKDVEIKVIDARRTDRTGRQHGVMGEFSQHTAGLVELCRRKT
jgi:hypothetical protein